MISDLSHFLTLQLAAAFCFGCVIWLLIGRLESESSSLLGWGIGSAWFLLATACSATGMWPHVIDLYPDDSHHTLPAFTGSLVFLVAATLAMAGIVMVQATTARLAQFELSAAPWILAPIIAVLVFWLEVLLAPQLFYTIYLLVFDGLLLQGVISPERSQAAVMAALFWQPGQSMAADGAGITLQAMILASVAETARHRQMPFVVFIGLLAMWRFVLTLPALFAF